MYNRAETQAWVGTRTFLATTNECCDAPKYRRIAAVEPLPSSAVPPGPIPQTLRHSVAGHPASPASAGTNSSERVGSTRHAKVGEAMRQPAATSGLPNGKAHSNLLFFTLSFRKRMYVHRNETPVSLAFQHFRYG